MDSANAAQTAELVRYLVLPLPVELGMAMMF
jgi:hypothetical protein